MALGPLRSRMLQYYAVNNLFDHIGPRTYNTMKIHRRRPLFSLSLWLKSRILVLLLDQSPVNTRVLDHVPRERGVTFRGRSGAVVERNFTRRGKNASWFDVADESSKGGWLVARVCSIKTIVGFVPYFFPASSFWSTSSIKHLARILLVKLWLQWMFWQTRIRMRRLQETTRQVILLIFYWTAILNFITFNFQILSV